MLASGGLGGFPNLANVGGGVVAPTPEPEPEPGPSNGLIAGWESQIGVWRRGKQDSKRTGKRYRIYAVQVEPTTTLDSFQDDAFQDDAFQ